MNGDVVGRLRAKLGLDRTEFSRGIRASKAETDDLGRSFAAMGDRLRAKLGLAVAAVSVQQIASSARAAVTAMASIGDEAKRAGMQVETFQEWKYVADQNRIGIDALVDSFKELNLRADEFIVTGGGPAAEAFQRIGFTAEELKRKLKDPNALMLEIIGRLEKLDRAAQIRITDELFGGAGGEQFVQLLDKGADSISALIARARDLGLIMDTDMIEKADELDAKFREVETRLQAMWRTGVVEAGYYFGLIERERERLTFDKDLTSQVVSEDVANALADLPEVPQTAVAVIESLNQEYVELGAAVRGLVLPLNDAANMLRGVGKEAEAIALTNLASRIAEDARAFDAEKISAEEYAERLREVVSEVDKTIGEMGELDQANLSGVIGQVQTLLEWIAKLPGAARDAKKEVYSLAMMDTGVPLSGSGADLLPPQPGQMESSPRPRQPDVDSYGNWQGAGASTGTGGGGGASRDEYAARAQAIREETAALEAEAVAMLLVAAGGKDYGNAVEFARKKAELLQAAQKQGKAITPELIAEIDALAAAYVTAGQEAEEAARKLEQIEAASERGRDALTDLFGAILDGADAARGAVANLLKEIAKAQFSKGLMDLLGMSGVGQSVTSVIGSLIGANAMGTPDWVGGLTRINELGGEIVDLPSGTRIIPHDISKRMADRASGASDLNIHVTASFDETGNLYVKDVARREAASAVAQADKALPARVQQINANPRRR